MTKESIRVKKILETELIKKEKKLKVATERQWSILKYLLEEKEALEHKIRIQNATILKEHLESTLPISTAPVKRGLKP